MNHDFIIKELLKDICKLQDKVIKMDNIHNAMYYRGKIDGLKSAIVSVETDKWASEIFDSK